MKRLLIIMLALFPALAFAAQVPILYSRSDIVIMRHALPAPPAPLPWQDKAAQPAAEAPGVRFDVEVRDARALYNQEGWFNLSGPADNGGVLMMFAQPAITPIVRSTQYAPMDILMIDAQGRITQIAPHVVLNQLDQDIVPPSPVLAFLFLKGGSCAALSITPGDEVEYKLFRKAPTVLTPAAEQKQ